MREESGQSPVLTDHLTIEEQVSGKPLIAGNSVSLLTDGPSTYASMLDAIRHARRYVYLESYILENDEVGERFAEALSERSQAGVTVAVMVDYVGTLSTPDAYFEALRSVGVKVWYFNSLNPFQSLRFWRANQRDHRKLLVVDGDTGFTGGFNLAAVYSSRPGMRGSHRTEAAKEDAPWRDTHVRIRGPAALDLEDEFRAGWEAQGGEPLPRTNDAERRASRARGDELVRILTSGPDVASPIYLTLLSAIARAQRSVHITMAYFVPDRQFLDTLEDASRRGVEVTLVLPGFSDFWMVFHAGRARYDELLRANVNIYEHRDALLHAKTVVVDSVWSTVGSSNLDWRSFVHNYEINAVVLGPAFGSEMEALFAKDIRESTRIELKDWQCRGWFTRVKEGAAILFSYWL